MHFSSRGTLVQTHAVISFFGAKLVYLYVFGTSCDRICATVALHLKVALSMSSADEDECCEPRPNSLVEDSNTLTHLVTTAYLVILFNGHVKCTLRSWYQSLYITGSLPVVEQAHKSPCSWFYICMRFYMAPLYLSMHNRSFECI